MSVASIGIVENCVKKDARTGPNVAPIVQTVTSALSAEPTARNSAEATALSGVRRDLSRACAVDAAAVKPAAWAAVAASAVDVGAAAANAVAADATKPIPHHTG